jgi:tRNA pseudouridine55 synthase
MNFDQVLLVDKPAGMTSFGVVARIRRVLTEQARANGWTGKRFKVGHTGTLDPFATGLMIVLTGKETKNAGDYSKLDKVYEATICLGVTSTTGDPEGEITPTASLPDLIGQSRKRDNLDSPIKSANDRWATLADNKWATSASDQWVVPAYDEVREVLSSFVCEIEQTPPVYSAIKIDGQRAYKLARKGKTPKIPARKVTIYDIELISYSYPVLKIRAHVSSGTYIRTLAEDIGKKLGTGAYTTELRRIKVGRYDVKNAQTLADFGIIS